MRDAAIDGISVDVVSPVELEAAIGVGMDRADGIAQRAADVDVDVGASHDHAGIVAAPGPDDVSDGRRGRRRAAYDGNNGDDRCD